MIFLIDHNLKGHALSFFGAIAAQGWLDILTIQFVTFDEIGLATDIAILNRPLAPNTGGTGVKAPSIGGLGAC